MYQNHIYNLAIYHIWCVQKLFSVLLMGVLTGCGKATIEKNDFIGKWELQTSLETGDEEADAAMSLLGFALKNLSDVDIDNIAIEITKNGKVVTYISDKKVSTDTYTISDDGKEISISDGSIATLNDDKDILTAYGDGDTSIDFKKIN